MTDEFQIIGPDGQSVTKWYSRRVGKPYYSGDRVCVNQHVDPPTAQILDDSPDLQARDMLQYLDPIYDTSTKQILDYYGLSPSTTLIPNIGGIHTPTRKMTTPVAQVSVAKSAIETASDAAFVPQNSNSKVIEIRNINRFLQHIGTAFKVYEQQLKFFNGSVAPHINFYDLLDKVKLFFKNLENFASFNDFDLHKFKSVNIQFSTSGYQIEQVYLVDSNLKQHPLNKGTAYYFETLPMATNKYVNEIVYNFYDILLGKRSKISWTQFIYDYLPNSGITVDFYGKPRTPTPQSELKKQQAANFFFGPLATTTADGASVRLNIGKADVRDEQFQAAKREIQRDQRTLQDRLRKITADIQNATEKANLVANILSKYNITTLIEAALECLLFKGGFNGSVPDFIPGISPFDPVPPKISLKFPPIEFKLPVISINKEMQVQIRESLKRAAIGAVMSMIQTIADLIRELCLTEPNESDQPAPVIPEEVIPPEDLSDLHDCYVDFGFDLPAEAQGLAIEAQTSGDVLEEFLRELSPLITARELCDLFNGFGPELALQVISNLIDSSYPSLRANFYDSEAIEGFFQCIGNLVDPSFCFNIYNDLVPIIPDIDPCTIEETQPFQDILDLLEGLEPIFDAVDLTCEGGVIPALSDIDAFNTAVHRLINSLMAPIQQTFISDITAYKSIVIQPSELSTEDQAELDRQRELLEFLQPPDPPDIPPAQQDFFQSMIPPAATEAFSGLQNISNALAGLGGTSQETLVADIQRILASRTLQVAPETQKLYQGIENNWAQNQLVVNAGSLTTEEALRYYSFLTPILLKGNRPGTYGRTISYILRGGNLKDIINVYNSPPRTGENPLNDLDYDVDDTIPAREVEAQLFKNEMLGHAAQFFNHNDILPALSDLFAKKLYPFTYFGLINAFAYKIGDSKLFDAMEMQNFSLLPKVCATDGSISQADLLDINNIKNEAFEDFVNNSCIEGNYELGPVRDAGLHACVNVYMQVLIVDLLLKNIFMVSKFGVSYMASGPGLVNELLQQALTKTLSFMAGQDAIGESFSMPQYVMRASAMVVKKTIDASFTFPISGAPQSPRQIEIINLLAQGDDVSSEDPDLQGLAVRYLFEKRLKSTEESVRLYFDVKGSTPVESYMLNGMLDVEIPDFERLPFPFDVAWSPVGPNVYGVATPEITTSEATGTQFGTRFFTIFDYINNGAAALDTMTFATPENQAAARIEAELSSFAKYGAIVSERFCEVGYNRDIVEEALSQFEGSGTILEYLSPLILELFDFFKDRVPMTTGDSYDEYLLSFPAFKSVFDQISLLANFASRTNVWLPIPFYLAGYNPLTGHDDRRPQEVAIQLNVNDDRGEFKGQDAAHWSDYNLISAFVRWFEGVEVAGPATFEYQNTDADGLVDYANTTEITAGRITTDEYGRETGWHKVSAFSPHNQIDWSLKHNNDELKEVHAKPRATADSGGNQSFTTAGGGFRDIGSTWLDQSQGYTRGTAAIHANKLLGWGSAATSGVRPREGEGSGPGEGAAPWGAGALSHAINQRWGPGLAKDIIPDSAFATPVDGDHRYVRILQSANFKIVMGRMFSSPGVDGDGNPRPPTGLPGSEYMFLRSRNQEGFRSHNMVGGSYSQVDFYSGEDGSQEQGQMYYDMMRDLFDNYRTEQDLLDASRFLNTPAINPDQEFTVQSADDPSPTYFQQLIEGTFPILRMGTRLSYLTPELTEDELETFAPLLSNSTPDLTTKKHKSYFIYPASTRSGDQAGLFAHITTDKKTSIDLTDLILKPNDDFARFLKNNGSTQGFSRFMDKLYQDHRPAMITQLAQSSESLFGDGKIVDVSKIMQYLYLVGEIRTFYSLFLDKDIFTDTKLTALLAIQAALAGSDADATSACDMDAIQTMMMSGTQRALGPLSDLGSSFAQKMLIDTPKHILKGICELCEPHMIVASQVKNASGIVFGGMDMAIQMANMGVDMANLASQFSGGIEGGLAPSACDEELGVSNSGDFDFATPEIPLIPNAPSLDSVLAYIQGKIDNKFPETMPDIMKPSVSKAGIDLMGSLPYTMFLPPLTPFGLVYLLLRLSEWEPEQVELVEDCESTYSELD